MKRLLSLLLCVFVTIGCKTYRCTHTVTVYHPAVADEMVYWPSESSGFGMTPYGFGIHMGGGLHLVPGHAARESSECDTWEEVK